MSRLIIASLIVLVAPVTVAQQKAIVGEFGELCFDRQTRIQSGFLLVIGDEPRPAVRFTACDGGCYAFERREPYVQNLQTLQGTRTRDGVSFESVIRYPSEGAGDWLGLPITFTVKPSGDGVEISGQGLLWSLSPVVLRPRRSHGCPVGSIPLDRAKAEVLKMAPPWHTTTR